MRTIIEFVGGGRESKEEEGRQGRAGDASRR